MSFRPLHLDACRAGLVAFVCVGGVWASSAADVPPQPIEVVPLHGSAMNTNVDQSLPESLNLESLGPHAPRSFNPTQPNQPVMPLPRSPVVNQSERERELLDRRRNWVFMTPEEFASPDSESANNFGLSPDGKNSGDKKAPTVMERYYQHLYDSERTAATNQFSRLDSDHRNAATNSVAGELSGDEPNGFASSPFDAVQDSGIFRSTRPNVFSDVFGSDVDKTMPSPEAVRLQAEQKAHLDNFKELWDIDQPATAPVTTSVPKPVSSAPLFGVAGSLQPTFNSLNLSDGSASSQQLPPVQPTVSSSRAHAPPHADFAPPQRSF